MTRLLMLPGLGADERMFEPQRADFSHLEVPPRLNAIHGESLRDHARRLADALDLTPGEPYILGGVSLGGMIAQELALVRPPQALILIATARNGSHIPRYFRFYEMLCRPLPSRVIETGRFVQPLISRAFSNVTPEQERLVTQMVDATPLEFIRWATRAIFAWPGCERTHDCPVYHVHGAADRLIPPARIAPPPARLIPGGGHLINITHAGAVNAFIREMLADGAGGAGPR